VAQGQTPIVIAAKYRLIRQLGSAGRASLWEAQVLRGAASVTLELLEPALVRSPEGLSRFTKEVRAAAALHSPYVAKVLDHGVDAGTPYVVMEPLVGESLAARLERVKKLSPSDTARTLSQVALALSRAHGAGVVHGDLQPESIFLLQGDGDATVKVLDFGISKAQGAPTKPYYASPERVEAHSAAEQRADLWSLGVIAFECLLGRRPFEGGNGAALLSAITQQPLPVPSRLGDVPSGFDDWFAKACARDVARRFAWAQDAGTELAKICAEPAKKASLPPRAKPPDLGLPQLVGTDEDEEMPTEIWRGGVIDQLGLSDVLDDELESRHARTEPPAAVSSLPPPPRPAPPPTHRPAPRPTTTVIQRAPAAEDYAAAPKSASRVWLFVLLVGALVAGAVSWLLFAPSQRGNLPNAASFQPSASRTAAATKPVPSGASSAAADAGHELLPTIDLSALPVAPSRARAPGRPASEPAAPGSPAGAARPPSGDGELPDNPYR
jgi:serine/threonine protein kinase